MLLPNGKETIVLSLVLAVMGIAFIVLASQ